ncbi:MAG: hypothetical protein PHS64_00290 [Candidatus Omnitrophica bacterium]|nr:hypothetical protein [Candidatus Omnitrophota bacterium]
MKLGQEITVNIGDDGRIVLREPSNREWNEFQSERYPVGRRNQMKDNSGPARVALFDKLVVKIENLEDDQGVITIDSKDRIPARIKGQIIFDAFEAASDVDIKN